MQFFISSTIFIMCNNQIFILYQKYITMSRNPDYIGNWMLPDDEEHFIARNIATNLSKLEYRLLSENGAGIFFMFVSNRQKEEDTEKISGIIIDNYKGLDATFEGVVGKGFVRFIKRYSKKNVIELGIDPQEIPYKGRIISPYKFRGIYHMKESKGNKKQWNGQFILIKYIDFILRRYTDFSTN